MKNKYINTEQILIDVDAIVDNIFIPEYELEAFKLCGNDYAIQIIECSFGVFVSLVSEGIDLPTTVHVDMDGSIRSSAIRNPTPELSDGVYYVGDELNDIGKTNVYLTKDEWLWDSVYKVDEVSIHKITNKTYKKLLKLIDN